MEISEANERHNLLLLGLKREITRHLDSYLNGLSPEVLDIFAQRYDELRIYKDEALHRVMARVIDFLEMNNRVFDDLTAVLDKDNNQVNEILSRIQIALLDDNILREVWNVCEDLKKDWYIKMQGRQIKRLTELVAVDDLTGLYNKKHFAGELHSQIDSAKRFGRPVSLLMLDLDHFKRINDTYSHDVGDQVLREFARRLKGAVRAYDVAARYGGEEFVVVLPSTDGDTACNVAGRIAEAVTDAPFKVKIHDDNGDREFSIKISISIGVAQMKEVDTNSPGHASFVNRADEGLYIAKGEKPDINGVVENRRGSIVYKGKVMNSSLQ